MKNYLSYDVSNCIFSGSIMEKAHDNNYYLMLYKPQLWVLPSNQHPVGFLRGLKQGEGSNPFTLPWARSSLVLGCCSVLVVSRVISAKQSSLERSCFWKAFSKDKQTKCTCSFFSYSGIPFTFGNTTNILLLSVNGSLFSEEVFLWVHFYF